MGNIEYKVIKDYGVIANHNGVELRLRLISWDGNPAKYDLRAWRNDYAMGGITMTKDELETLGIHINELNLQPKPVVDLTALKVSEPITAPKKRGRPAKSSVSVEEKKEDVKTDDTKGEEKPKKKANVIEFPKPKEEIEKLITDGHATYAECIVKIEGYKAIYKDADSQYVLDGVLELCKVDKDFRNNVMREDKDYEGALDYMADMCQKGYGYKKGSNYGFLDRDAGLGFTIDYFNLKPEPEPEVKESATNTVIPKKRGRKKKIV